MPRRGRGNATGACRLQSSSALLALALLAMTLLQVLLQVLVMLAAMMLGL